MLRVTRLFHYPVKSLAGITIDRLELSPRGPKWDREWMLVDPAGKFLSQRTFPKMARIQPSLTPDSLLLTAGVSSISVPLASSGPRRKVVVWKDACDGLDEGDAASSWLSDFLSTPCRLVRIAPDFRRIVHPSGVWTAFADGGPVLVITEESLADLSRRAGLAFEAERFRPNVVVSGAPAWAEDGWKALTGGGVTLHAAKACSRCAITTLDPVTGEGGPEPLKTLATFRRGSDGGVNFGVYCVPEGDAVLSVGDSLSA